MHKHRIRASSCLPMTYPHPLLAKYGHSESFTKGRRHERSIWPPRNRGPPLPRVGWSRVESGFVARPSTVYVDCDSLRRRVPRHAQATLRDCAMAVGPTLREMLEPSCGNPTLACALYIRLWLVPRLVHTLDQDHRGCPPPWVSATPQYDATQELQLAALLGQGIALHLMQILLGSIYSPLFTGASRKTHQIQRRRPRRTNPHKGPLGELLCGASAPSIVALLNEHPPGLHELPALVRHRLGPLDIRVHATPFNFGNSCFFRRTTLSGSKCFQVTSPHSASASPILHDVFDFNLAHRKPSGPVAE